MQQICSQLQSDIQHSRKEGRNFLVTLLDMLVMVCTSLPFTSLRPLPPLPRSDVCGQHGESRWQHAEPEYRWHQGGRGAPEAEVREVPWCCVDGLLRSQTEPKIML